MKKNLSILSSILFVVAIIYYVSYIDDVAASDNSMAAHYQVHVAPYNNCSGNRSGATVTVKDAGGSTVLSGMTDANGWADFIANGMPTGYYTIYASYGSYCVSTVEYYDGYWDYYRYVCLGYCPDNED